MDPALVGTSTLTISHFQLIGARLFDKLKIFSSPDSSSMGYDALLRRVHALVARSEHASSSTTPQAARQCLVAGLAAMGEQMGLFLSTPATTKIPLPAIPKSRVVDILGLERDEAEHRNIRRLEQRFGDTSGRAQSSSTPASIPNPMPTSGVLVPFSSKKQKTVT